MSYWSATDLAQFIPQVQYGVDLVTATSIPVNASQFQKMIDLTGAEVDAALLRGGWVAPVPSTATAFLQVQSFVLHGAAAKLYERIPGAQPRASEYRTAYDSMLKSITDGSVALVGIQRDQTEAGRVLPRGASQTTTEAATLRVRPDNCSQQW